MTRIPVRTIESAPAQARLQLEEYVKTSPTGKVLNLHGAMANAPIVLEMYARMRRTIEEFGQLDRKAQWAAMLSVGSRNQAAYSSQLYAALGRQYGLTGDQIRAISAGRECGEPALDAMVAVASEIAGNSGHVSDHTWNAALAAGWSVEALSELFACVGLALFLDYFVNYSEVESDLRPGVPA